LTSQYQPTTSSSQATPFFYAHSTLTSQLKPEDLQNDTNALDIAHSARAVPIFLPPDPIFDFLTPHIYSYDRKLENILCAVLGQCEETAIAITGRGGGKGGGEGFTRAGQRDEG
jgi:hypothetical protein